MTIPGPQAVSTQLPGRARDLGCTFRFIEGGFCQSTQTVTVDGVCGRRCSAHPPAYSREYRNRLCKAGDYHGAFAYLRAWLAWACTQEAAA